MKTFARYALSIGATSALLAGCGGSQPPIGAPGAMSQSLAIATHAGRGGSWILPEAKSKDLLYIANILGNDVTVYTYPYGKLVGDLGGLNQPNGLCVDKAGDVFIANFGGEAIVEYAHGGTVPIETLADNGTPSGCAIDPTSGDLAVVNSCDGPIGSCYPSGTVLIYKHARGRPKSLTDPYSYQMLFCSYSRRGNLAVNGLKAFYQIAYAELRKGSSTFVQMNITLPRRAQEAGGVQWDSADNLATSVSDGNKIYDYHVTGINGKLIDTTRLEEISNGSGTNQFWIQGSKVVAEEIETAKYPNGRVLIYDYPGGGKPTKIITDSVDFPWAAAISPGNM